MGRCTSDNATSRSPDPRSSRARTAAIVWRLIASLRATSRQRRSAGPTDPSAAALVFAPVPARIKSFGCCLDPPQLRQQLARGSKPLWGEHPATTAARAAEPPTVGLSSPPGHLLGAVKPRGGGAPITGEPPLVPGMISRDHNRDKSQQSTTVSPVAQSGIGRQSPCKPAPCSSRRRSLHTREVGGSKPPVPILRNLALSGRPGESHPQAPSDPGVTVSRHRALLTSSQYARTHRQWSNRPGCLSSSPAHHRLNRL